MIQMLVAESFDFSGKRGVTDFCEKEVTKRPKLGRDHLDISQKSSQATSVDSQREKA